MGRGGLDTAMDLFGVDDDTGVYSTSKDSKAPLSETGEWSDTYDVDVPGDIDDEWSGLLMGFEGDLIHPLGDQADSGSISGFNRSASAPDLLSMPGGGVPPWSRPTASPKVPSATKSKQKTATERSVSTPSLTGLPVSQFARPGKQSSAMTRSASTSTLVGLDGRSMWEASMRPKVHPKLPPTMSLKSIETANERRQLSSDDSSASPRPKSAKRRVSRTPEERKQRRLETNRAAAKRAYYRRQAKMNVTKHDNDRLRKLTELQADRIRVYEAVLREAGYDPEAVVEQSPVFAVRASQLCTEAAQIKAEAAQIKADGMQLEKEDSSEDESSPPTASAVRTRRGRAVRPTKR